MMKVINESIYFVKHNSFVLQAIFKVLITIVHKLIFRFIPNDTEQNRIHKTDFRSDSTCQVKSKSVL
jgi:hypothetical protein